MALLVAAFGLFVTALGVLGVASPSRLVAFVARWQTRGGLYAIAAIRIAFGAALLVEADGSRAPLAFRVLGGLALLSGLVTPFFGLERFGAILDWWSRQPAPLLRVWCAAVVAFGAFVVWGVTPGLR